VKYYTVLSQYEERSCECGLIRRYPMEIARAQEQASKWKRLAEEKRVKLQAMEQEEKINADKIEKTRQTLENHERREKEWVAKLDEKE